MTTEKLKVSESMEMLDVVVLPNGMRFSSGNNPARYSAGSSLKLVRNDV